MRTTWQPLSNETKPLTFLFLFSGSSSAELFSPSNYVECYLENIKNTTTPPRHSQQVFITHAEKNLKDVLLKILGGGNCLDLKLKVIVY